ncbi:GNAT family N-acetyltransferase [Vulgatibacter incomptus]|uniref:Acetyltransferase, GNAT family n=1 Tax=Vulgatibacter incomptus TaxID=1391653 RepID=A0A0K1PFT6_9BACT|nr:GNAT family N-acetyltransferase [Vulgatibacter incomptus]AKU91979.1 acetyltransferase, GNAT family [Vulgatibacter incomptus]
MSRSPDSDHDFRRMDELVRAAWKERGPHVPFTAGDLQWRMNRNDLVRMEHIRLWEAPDGTLLGFAWRYARGEIDVLFHPASHAERLVPEVIEWSESLEEPRPTIWALEGDRQLAEALVDAGLAPTGGCYLHLARPVRELELRPTLPPGFSLRGVDAGELAARAAAHRAAFGSERLQASIYERLVRAPLYRPEHDVVALTPEGEMAAFALGWFDPATGVGELEPVGTVPAWRGLGLARAASMDALRRMAEAGARLALVYALATDPVSSRLYQSIGLQIVDRNLSYARPA